MKTISLDEMKVQPMTHREMKEVEGGSFLLILGITIAVAALLEWACNRWG